MPLLLFLGHGDGDLMSPSLLPPALVGVVWWGVEWILYVFAQVRGFLVDIAGTEP